MALFASNPPSLIPANQQSAGSVNQTASRLNAGSRAVKDAAAQSMFQSTGGALSSLQDQIDNITRVMRSPIPQPDAYSVADPSGNLIAWIGFNIVDNVVYQGGWFANVYIGGTNASNAPFFANGSQVVIGKNGQVFIEDLGGNTVGWFGVESETALVITAATNASPSVITIAGHGYVDGDTITIAGAVGNTAINGYRIVQNVTLNTFTTTTLAGVAVNGNGVYTGSGTATRYYAGVLTQTIAIGESFANYKLRAFADGSLKIQDATISLSGTGGTIVLDPVSGSITVTDAGGGDQIILQSGTITYQVVDVNGAVILDDSSGTLSPGLWQSFNAGLTSDALSRVMDVYGYTGATAFGPLLSFTQSRGTPTTPTATQSGDALGGVIGWGYDGSGESSYAASMKFVANENHTVTNHGANVIIEVTAAGGATTPVQIGRFSSAGILISQAQDAATVIQAENTDASGTSANAALTASADTAVYSIHAQGSGRVIVRYGITLGGWNEFDVVAGSGLIIGTRASKPIVFGTNNLERMRISGGGNIGIGLAASTYALEVAGDLDISGVYRKGGAAGIAATITTAKLTALGLNGSMTFAGGILTAQTQST